MDGATQPERRHFTGRPGSYADNWGTPSGHHYLLHGPSFWDDCRDLYCPLVEQKPGAKEGRSQEDRLGRCLGAFVWEQMTSD